MKVWVAIEGQYSDQRIVGVYASIEAAITANPTPADHPGWHLDQVGDWSTWVPGSWRYEGMDLTEFDLEGIETLELGPEMLSALANAQPKRTPGLV